MKILLVCDVAEGLATEVVLFLKSEAERMNRRVVVLNAGTPTLPAMKYDAIVVAGELKNSTISAVLTHFISENREKLNETPSFFLPVVECADENDLKVPDGSAAIVRDLLAHALWKPQQIMVLPVGTRLQEHEFVTLADWPALKMSLQRFMIRNDVMMVS